MCNNLIILIIIIIITIMPSFGLSVDQKIKIVVIKSQNAIPYEQTLMGFKDVISNSQINYEGKTYLYTNNNITSILNEIHQNDPDIVFTIGTRACKTFCELLKNRHLIFASVLHPEQNEIAHFMSGEYGNICGSSLDVPVEIQLNLLKQSFKNLSRIGVLYHPVLDSNIIRQSYVTANALNLKLVTEALSSKADIPAKLERLEKNSDMLWLISNPFTVNYYSLKYIMIFCLSHNYPLAGFCEHQVKAGAILGFHGDFYTSGKQAGQLVLQYVKSGKFSSNCVLYPHKVKLYVNIRTAKIMGLHISQTILRQAEKIYE